MHITRFPIIVVIVAVLAETVTEILLQISVIYSSRAHSIGTSAVSKTSISGAQGRGKQDLGRGERGRGRGHGSLGKVARAAIATAETWIELLSTQNIA